MGVRMLGKATCIAAALAVAGCGEEQRMESAPDLDDLARKYVVLELTMGLHDDNHVDAYFGPEELRQIAQESPLTLTEIADEAGALAEQVAKWPGNRSDRMQLGRIDGLQRRLRALSARVAINQGQTFSFDEESRLLFGVTAPDYDAAHFEDILQRIDELLPGAGSLSARVNDFQNRFVIPPDKLAAVFDAAIAECRRRTLEKIDLPEEESFSLEYVTEKPWSGYNWYQGRSQSLIQINTDLPIFISRAVDLGCHEGYPGHHTFNVLLEKNLVQREGWVEFTLYPLFSPQSLIAEGSANYGVELAFPGNERVEFEKLELFPLAGLDPAEADRYYALQELLDRLSYAGNEAARDYLDGDIDREQAARWLEEYALASPERARQRVDFFDTYRSYVINYNLGQDLVRGYVERGIGPEGEQQGALEERRWKRFTEMLSTPTLPSDLAETTDAR
ncbi:MAG TPA: hypothetical protein VKZ91_02330 [Woeseiaceae bacterium]|nr:hypothetical protein [Woeseiaceae bacterium]